MNICSAYRIISTDGAGVIVGVPPIKLQITERKERYSGVTKEAAKDQLIAKFQTDWDSGRTGRWTHLLIPNIRNWLERPYGEVDYYLTQAYGSFRKYLYDRRRHRRAHSLRMLQVGRNKRFVYQGNKQSIQHGKCDAGTYIRRTVMERNLQSNPPHY